MDAGKYTSVIFIDLRKAFHTIDDTTLLLNGFFLSKLEGIKYEVPQGFWFGPLLFLLYINDLHLALKNS